MIAEPRAEEAKVPGSLSSSVVIAAPHRTVFSVPRFSTVPVLLVLPALSITQMPGVAPKSALLADFVRRGRSMFAAACFEGCGCFDFALWLVDCLAVHSRFCISVNW